ncbi:hypothetical protein L3X38_012008 [Prunus dulcis]|uniref:Uncharacterized protein n=1 Tax=Prunus dulcis TaxID=3755 RepID=A0AAD4WKY0_PRUDU|nr:hypothetical protein L3X38_012008 [Prunus dulcis]
MEAYSGAEKRQAGVAQRKDKQEWRREKRSGSGAAVFPSRLRWRRRRQGGYGGDGNGKDATERAEVAEVAAERDG